MKFSQEIINVLDYLCQKFGVAIDWTSENVVPYLKDLGARYISYEVFTSIAWMVIFVAVTLIILIPTKIFHKRAKEVCWDDNNNFGVCFAAVIGWIAFGIMAFISICVIGTQVFDIIECYTLPEKVILRYLKTLVDSAK